MNFCFCIYIVVIKNAYESLSGFLLVPLFICLCHGSARYLVCLGLGPALAVIQVIISNLAAK